MYVYYALSLQAFLNQFINLANQSFSRERKNASSLVVPDTNMLLFAVQSMKPDMDITPHNEYVRQIYWCMTQFIFYHNAI